MRDQARRTPLVPFNASGADNAPMAELTAACKRHGLWPFTMGNRIHVVPPLTIAEHDLREGLAIIDEALATVDRYASV